MRVLSFFLRILGIIAILLIALAMALRIALDTDLLRNTLRETAMESAPGLELGSITGDLWHGFMLHDLAYADSAITITIDSVGVRYHAWELLRGLGDIRTVEIFRPVVWARSGETVADSDTSAFTLPIDIRIGSVIVRDGSLRWNDLALARALQIDASARWQNNTPSVTIHRLETSVGGFGLDSTSVRLSGSSQGSVITLEQLVVATGRTLINGSGTTDVKNETLDADFLLSPLSWRDITALAGEMPLQEDLDLSVTLSGRYDALKVLLDVRSARYPRVSAGLTFTPDSLLAAGTVHTGRTPVTFTAATDWSAAAPGADLMVNAIGFDLRSVAGFADFPSSINATLLARVEDDGVDATLDVGKSTLNRVALSSAHAEVRFADGVVTVNEGAIRSDIVNGDFKLRQRLDDPADLGNRLDAVFTLLNLQPLAPLAGVDSLSASGRIVATLARGTAGLLRFDAELDLRDVRIDTMHVGHANSRIEASIDDISRLSANLNLTQIRLGDMALPFAAFRAEGRLHPDHIQSFVAVETQLSDKLSFVHEGDMEIREGDIRHRGTRLDVRMMSERYRLAEPFEMRSDASGLHLDALHLISSTGAELRDVGMYGVRIEGTYADDRINLLASAHHSDGPWFDMTVSLPFLLDDPETIDEAFFSEPVSGSITLHPTKLQSLGKWFEAMSLSPIPGTVYGGLSLGGTAGHPTFTGDLRLLRSSISAVPIDSLGVEWSFDATDASIRLASTLVSLGQPALEIDGRIPFEMDMRRFTPILDPTDNGLDLAITTRNFNLDALSLFLDSKTIRRLQGRINGDLSLSGRVDAPELTGRFEITQASAYLPEANIQISDVGVDLRFEPGRLIIQDVSARSNGVAKLTGTVDLDGFDISGMDLALKGDVIRLSDTRNALIFLTIDTRLKGGINAPKLTGTLSLDRGHLFLEEFGENQVEQIILSDEDANLLDGIALYENLEMELIFKTERGFWVRNRSGPEMNLELNGELDILKSKGGEVALFGTMGTNQGNVSQLGKRFVMEKGELTFSGDAENPQLAIRSAYQLKKPNDITIWYEIGGTAAKPTFTFESEPEMDQTDIVSYTLFNRPYQQLMSWEQTMSGSSSIGNLAVDLLVDRVGELAADRLGLDVIEIDNSRTSGNSGTTIKAGKYLNDKLFVAIFQELGTTSDSQVILEYALRQHLNLVLTGSDKRKSGIDIQWKYDY